ncbi:unnamed protein product [Lota lota]
MHRAGSGGKSVHGRSRDRSRRISSTCGGATVSHLDPVSSGFGSDGSRGISSLGVVSSALCLPIQCTLKAGGGRSEEDRGGRGECEGRECHGGENRGQRTAQHKPGHPRRGPSIKPVHLAPSHKTGSSTGRQPRGPLRMIDTAT